MSTLSSNLFTKKLTILMSSFEKKELLREMHAIARKKGVLTLRSMHARTQNLYERIYKSFDLKPDIVKNVIAYARCLPRPGSEVIDHSIFCAQMKRHFNLTNTLLLGRMYEVCCIDERNKIVTVDEYIELICIFLSEIRDLKIQFVFKCYNPLGGFLSKKDLEYFIKPMVSQIGEIESEDIDGNTTVKTFVEMLMKVVDENGDEHVDLDEFRHLTERNVLMMQCLGPCIPDEEDRNRFILILSDKTDLEANALFRFERRIALCAPKISSIGGIQKYYPVQLELP